MTTLLMRRSATPGAVPTAAQLSAGELAVNTADGKVFFERADGEIIQVPGFPTTWSGAGAGLNIDFGSLDSPVPITVISFGNPASVGLDFGGLL